MDMHARGKPARGLGLQHAVEGSSRVLGNEESATQTSVISNHDALAILDQNLDRPTVEQVAILAYDVSLGPFPHDRCLRKDKDLLQLLDRDAQAHSIAWPEPP